MNRPSRRDRRDAKKMIVRGKPGSILDAASEPHWKCPDCALLCYCVGDARIMLHVRCGEPPSDDQIDEGARQAYESWQRGGHGGQIE